MPLPSREWDSAAYDRISTPQFTWGKKVLDQLALRGDESVLDAGCGTGKLTAELLSLLPKGRVVGIDLSENMLRTARANLASSREAFLVSADLQNLPFWQVFDLIFSTAAFHWVPDHDRLFSNLLQTLRPGGWLIAQCGGGPNLSRFLDHVSKLAQNQTYARYVGAYRHGWVFSFPDAAREQLQNARFTDIDVGLVPAPTQFASPAEFSEFVAKVILHRFLEHLPNADMQRAFLAELTAQAAEADPPLELDYWRLNLRARRPI
ncbi:MAG TPA: methyltransferase domain-containing protein [Terriglobales bacterium]|nr:methyltransferase domain-containing protein [Terriglobales bacterium]